MGTLTIIDGRSFNRDSEVPNVLYRRFSDRGHAEDFMKGNIIFRSVQYYNLLEEKGNKVRGDSNEGSANYSKKVKVEIQIGDSYFPFGFF